MHKLEISGITPFGPEIMRSVLDEDPSDSCNVLEQFEQRSSISSQAQAPAGNIEWLDQTDSTRLLWQCPCY
jgi:hypothetical protein